VAAALVPLAAMAAVVLPAGSASAGATALTNTCRNNVNAANWDQINVRMTGTAPTGTVQAGSKVTLSNLTVQLAIPSSIFVIGYNANLLHTGVNKIPATVNEVIDATNTVEGSQPTGVPDLPPGFHTNATVTTTITDPDGVKGNGDETATDGATSVTFSNMTWTAAATGPITFSEHNDPAITGATGGGLTAVAHLLADGSFSAKFHCTSGTVAGSDPGVPTFTNAPAMDTSKDSTGLTLAASATKVKKGTTVRFTGRIQDSVTKAYPNGQKITLQRRLGTSGAWQSVASALTKTVNGKRGTAVFALKVTRSYYYSVKFNGTAAYGSSRSKTVHVVVK
jgi:hypothetical protein